MSSNSDFESDESEVPLSDHVYHSKNENILVTGGCGYIGTHTVLCLLNAGYDVTIVDNLCNSSIEGLNRVLFLAKCNPARIRFFNFDMRNEKDFENVFTFSKKKYAACIHFAGLKAVGESVEKPILYYKNNIGITLNLLEFLEKYDCRSLVFSSSATVQSFYLFIY